MREIPLAALCVFLLLAALAAPQPAHAQFSNCQAIAQRLPGSLLVPVSLSTPVNAEKFEVEITYVGHSTFRIVAPDGTTIATDYAGIAGVGKVPEVVTMNHAHSSHWTAFPDPAIAHVLRGCNPDGGKAELFLNVG